jgi:hypothetical protein
MYIACTVTCWSVPLCSDQRSLGNCQSEVFTARCDHCHSAVFSAPYGHYHSTVFSAPYGQCHSAPYRRSPLCSGSERPRSSYSLTSKRCSSQSLPPFQRSAEPNMLKRMSTAIKPQPSLRHRCCFLSSKLSHNFRSQSIIFNDTSADLWTLYKMVYIMYSYKQSGAMLLICWGCCPKCPTVKMLII